MRVYIYMYACTYLCMYVRMYACMYVQSNLLPFALHCVKKEEKIYVQHVIVQNGEFLARKLLDGAHVLVAGNSNNMPEQVRDAFVQILQKFGNMPDASADSFIKTMEKQKKYVCETWS
eukprot:m.106895 g.106895  ORF g.106895 m.106895 type:complete len:118 (-) comp9164_c0_seq2:774-1127(-)